MSKLRGLKVLFQGKQAWIVNTFVGGGLFTVGDLIEQSLEIRYALSNHYNFARTARMAVIGLLQAPSHQMVYKVLEKWYPGNHVRAVWKKVVWDQMISCPVFHINFFMGMGIMEGKSVHDAWGEFLRKFPTVYLIDLILWTPCQLITFFFIPLNYRVVFTNTLTVIWNIFLSYMKHYDQHEDPRIAECCRKGTCKCHLNENPVFLLFRHLVYGSVKKTKGETKEDGKGA